MRVREILDSERERWNAFVANSTSGDLLQSFEWGELKRRSGDWAPIRIAVENDGEIVAAASILTRRLPRVGKCIFYSPRGPICDWSDESALVALVEFVKNLASREQAILWKVDPAVEADRKSVIDTLLRSGFTPLRDPGGFGGIQPRCVMKLDLRPTLEEILASCKPKWRYNIRLAERKGVQVRQSSNENDLAIFYDLLVETACRDGFLIRGRDYYHHMWDILVSPGYAALFLAEYQGEAIAGALSFVFGDKCWYTYGASSNRHRNVMPNHLLQWRMIEWAKARGCSVYDFRGVSPNPTAGDHLSGLNRFKEGFGAQFVEYIGEYDLPFSKFWYGAWVSLRPGAAKLLKWLKGKSARGVSADGV